MPPSLTRRDFLIRGAAGTAASLTPAGAAVGPLFASVPKDSPVDDKPIPIVDTHQHLWDLDRFNLSWLKNDGVEPLRRSFVTADYLKAVRDSNVARSIYMEVNVHPDQQTKEAEYVVGLCKDSDNPMTAAVVGGSPHEKGFAGYIRGLAASPYVKGVRTVLHDPDRPQGLCLRPQFIESMQLLGELKLRFDLCMRPEEIIDGARLAEKCPKTRFIIDHCGNMSVASTDRSVRAKWQQGMQAAAGLENTLCKISGIVVTAKDDQWKPADLADNVNFCLETFGEDRCFFGGDWPVCTLKSTYARWVDALKVVVKDRTPEFEKKLFHDNAVRVYELADSR